MEEREGAEAQLILVGRELMILGVQADHMHPAGLFFSSSLDDIKLTAFIPIL